MSDQLVEEFLGKIDEWINNQEILTVSYNREEIEVILSLDTVSLKQLDIDTLLMYGIQLNSYAHHLQQLKNRENCVFNFASESIWSVISKVMDKLPADFSKGQKKNYYLAIDRCNIKPLAQLKNNCEARLHILENQIELVENKCRLLNDLAKRKQYA